MFNRKIIQRVVFAMYILVIFYSIFEVYNIIFDYYTFLERIINYHKIYFIAIQVLVIITVVDLIILMVEKTKE